MSNESEGMGMQTHKETKAREMLSCLDGRGGDARAETRRKLVCWCVLSAGAGLAWVGQPVWGARKDSKWSRTDESRDGSMSSAQSSRKSGPARTKEIAETRTQRGPRLCADVLKAGGCVVMGEVERRWR